MNVILYYLQRASDDQLSTFIEEITHKSLFDNSICSELFSRYHIDAIAKFTKELSKRLGENAVKRVVLHKNHQSVIFKLGKKLGYKAIAALFGICHRKTVASFKSSYSIISCVWRNFK